VLSLLLLLLLLLGFRGMRMLTFSVRSAEADFPVTRLRRQNLGGGAANFWERII